MTTKKRPSIGPLFEYVFVRLTRARYRDLQGALAASLDGLVDPAVTVDATRERLSRLALSIFTVSFVLAAAIALASPGVVGPAGILAAISATLAVSWLAALSVSSARAEPFAAFGMLGFGAVAIGGLVAVSGGGASPLALLMVALIAEPLSVYRSRKAAWAGAGAVVIALLTTNFASLEIAGVAQAWFWPPVLAYLAFCGARIASPQSGHAATPEQALAYVGESAVALRFGSDGEVADAPSATPSDFGIEPALLLDTGLRERVHVADRVAFMSAMADLRAGKGARAELRLRLPLGPGEPATEIRHGQFELNIASDGQAVLRQANELGRLREQLAEAERHAASIATAKSRLLASVSHELRTPLNAIIGFSDMLLLDLCGSLADPRQREHVTLVRDSGVHLLGVVNAILDVSRIESGVHALTPESFRFSDAVDLCHSMIAAQAAAKQITIGIDIGREVGELTADRRAVQQILINLVSNAVKFTPEGGVIKVSAERIGSKVSFAVEDNGIGIAEEDLVRIGQPFTQVRNEYTRQYDGLGLGLSLVKGLVALHGGSMEIDSAPSEGTVVSVSLPVNGPVAGLGGERLIKLDDKRPKEMGNGKRHKTA